MDSRTDRNEQINTEVSSEEDSTEKQIEHLCRFAQKHVHGEGIKRRISSRAAKIFLSFFCGDCTHYTDNSGACELCGQLFN